MCHLTTLWRALISVFYFNHHIIGFLILLMFIKYFSFLIWDHSRRFEYETLTVSGCGSITSKTYNQITRIIYHLMQRRRQYLSSVRAPRKVGREKIIIIIDQNDYLIFKKVMIWFLIFFFILIEIIINFINIDNHNHFHLILLSF